MTSSPCSCSPRRAPARHRPRAQARARSTDVSTTAPPPSVWRQQSRRWSGELSTGESSTSPTASGPAPCMKATGLSSAHARAATATRRAARTSCRTRACAVGRRSRRRHRAEGRVRELEFVLGMPGSTTRLEPARARRALVRAVGDHGHLAEPVPDRLRSAGDEEVEGLRRIVLSVQRAAARGTRRAASPGTARARSSRGRRRPAARAPRRRAPADGLRVQLERLLSVTPRSDSATPAIAARAGLMPGGGEGPAARGGRDPRGRTWSSPRACRASWPWTSGSSRTARGRPG